MTTYNPFPSLASIEAGLAPGFTGEEETNIQVVPGMKYKFGYGAEIKTIYFVDKVKLVGIVFCDPDSDLGSKEILPRLEYLHYRSGENTDLFWAGYGPFMEQHVPSGVRPVKKVEGTMWGFSAAQFNALRQDIEARTRWAYSGETDLLLMTARFDSTTKRPYLDFSEVLVCDLDRMIRQGAIPSVSRFLEDVFRFADQSDAKEAYDFSDLKLLEVSKKTLWEWFLGFLHVKDYYERTEPFAIRNITKQQPS